MQTPVKGICIPEGCVRMVRERRGSSFSREKGLDGEEQEER